MQLWLIQSCRAKYLYIIGLKMMELRNAYRISSINCHSNNNHGRNHCRHWIVTVASISNDDYRICARAVWVLQPNSTMTAALRGCMYYCQFLSVVTLYSAAEVTIHWCPWAFQRNTRSGNFRLLNFRRVIFSSLSIPTKIKRAEFLTRDNRRYV